MKSLAEIFEVRGIGRIGSRINSSISNSTSGIKYDLNGTKVQNGQKIEVKHWREGSPNYIVTYLKPHEGSSFFYGIEADGSVKAIKKDRIVKILDTEQKEKKLSRSQAEKLSDELYELRRKIRDVNYDMEEELAGLGEEAFNGNNPTVARYAKQLDDLHVKAAAIEKKLNSSGW